MTTGGLNMEAKDRNAPLARKKGLVVRELEDEVLIYDRERHQAHSLNRVAALVWRHCDGKTSVADLSALLQQETGVPTNEELVWLALNRLGRAHLLRERLSLPAGVSSPSRRALLRNAAMVGGLVLVTSVVAPEAAYATSICTGCPTGNCCHLPPGAPTCVDTNPAHTGKCSTSSNCHGGFCT